MTLLLPAAALAHHGRDFLVTSSYKTPERGDFFAVLSSDYLRFNHEGVSGYEISPAILYGITDNWSVEFHSHHGIADGTVVLEAVAVESMIRLIGDAHDGGGDGAPFSLAATAFSLAARIAMPVQKASLRTGPTATAKTQTAAILTSPLTQTQAARISAAVLLFPCI